MLYANNKGAYHPVHPRSLISTFFVRCLDSTVYNTTVVSVNRTLSL